MQHRDIISTVLEHKHLFYSVLDLSSSSENKKFLQKGAGTISWATLDWQHPFSLLLLLLEKDETAEKRKVKIYTTKISFLTWLCFYLLGNLDLENIYLIMISGLVCSLDFY